MLKSAFCKRVGISEFQPAVNITQVVFPLTYDEFDYANYLAWTRTGNAPHVTPRGFEGDGYTARYLASTDLPAWATSSAGALTLHASATAENGGARNASRDVIVSVCTNDSSADPRLEISTGDDVYSAAITNIQVRCKTSSGVQSKQVGRNQWIYEGRPPEIAIGANGIRPQGILFLDADTALICGHFNNTLSRCYKMQLSDWSEIDRFDFPSPYFHVGAITVDAAGNYWFGDYDSGTLLKIDLAASFSSGTASVTLSYDMTAIRGFAAIDFVTISSTEYLLAAEYATSAPTYLYVLPASSIVNSGTFAVVDRTKRFSIPTFSQGVNYDSGKLFLAYGGSAGIDSAISRYDLSTALTSLADGAALVAETSWITPSKYPEDLDFHPTTGAIWTGTEGKTSTGSDDGFLAYWSSPLTGLPVENHYTIEYNGAGTVRIKINGKLFEDMPWTPVVSPAAISVGGPPVAAAGQANGFFIGYVRNIVIQDSALTATDYAAAVNGDYEPNTLTVYTVPLTNPGAEVGNTSGWTAEVGGAGVRTANPTPYEGGYYFNGGPVLQTIMRQRVALTTVTGLSAVDLDTATMWGKAKCWMANFDALADPGCIGLRFLNATPTQISQAYSGLNIVSPASTWVRTIHGLDKPTLARYVDIQFRSDRTAGTNNDSYFDSFELVLYKR